MPDTLIVGAGFVCADVLTPGDVVTGLRGWLEPFQNHVLPIRFSFRQMRLPKRAAAQLLDQIVHLGPGRHEFEGGFFGNSGRGALNVLDKFRLFQRIVLASIIEEVITFEDFS